MNRNLIADYQYCKRVIKKNSKSFYTAFSHLPQEKANSIFAVYTFCRLVDDVVDDAKNSASATTALQSVEANLKSIYAGKMLDEKGWVAFADSIKKWNIPIEPFLEQIKGQYLDIQFNPFQTTQALLEYCDLVAGSVGRMLLPILATKNQKKLEKKVGKIGQAMQLTNILRDVGEDLMHHQRVYLPMDRISFFNINLESLKKLQVSKNFILLWEELATEAEALYQSGIDAVLQFDNDSVEAVLFSMLIYKGIHNAVRKNKYDCLSTQNYLSTNEMHQIIKEGKKIIQQGATDE